MYACLSCWQRWLIQVLVHVCLLILVAINSCPLIMKNAFNAYLGGNRVNPTLFGSNTPNEVTQFSSEFCSPAFCG